MNCFAGCSAGFFAGLLHGVSGLDGRGVELLESTRVIEFFVDAESSLAFRPRFGKIFLTKDADVSILFLNERSERRVTSSETPF